LVDQLPNFWIGLSVERNRAYFCNASRSRCLRKSLRIDAVAGDDSEMIERLQIRAAEKL